MLGLIGAMSIEIDGIKEQLKDKKVLKIANLEFVSGLLCSKPVVCVQCGIGKVNSAVAATLMIANFSPNGIINLGVAGGIGKGIRQGDIVVADKTVYHDYDQSEDSLPLGLVSGFTDRFFYCDASMHSKMVSAIKSYNYNVFEGVAATGDQFIANKGKCAFIVSEFGALCCDMESASIAHVCQLLNVPYLSVRAISDNADGSATQDFYSFVTEAAKRSMQVVEKFVQL